jgi:hypothetical protein
MELKIAKPENLRMALAWLIDETKKFHIAFEGDLTKGSGSGRGFAAQYAVCSDHILLTVTEKLFVIGDAKIEKEVNKYWARQCPRFKEEAAAESAPE